MTPDPIAEAATPRAADIAAWLYPDGQRVRADWLADGLSINLGLRAGVFKDATSGEVLGNSFVLLTARARNLPVTEARMELAGFLGVEIPVEREALPARREVSEEESPVRNEARTHASSNGANGFRPQSSPAEDAFRLLPQSPESEQGILCSILRAPDECMKVCDQKVSPRIFHIQAHRTIYTALHAMWSEREPIDISTLTIFLHGTNELQSVGGPAFIAELYDFVATAANVAYYIEIAREKYVLREIKRVCDEYARRAIDEQNNVAELLEEIEARVTSIASDRKGQTIGGLPPLVRGNDIAEKAIVLPEELISGMLHRGAKMVLGGGSKSFKTWCLADLAISIASGRDWWGNPVRQGRVVYLNLEVQSAFFEQRLKTIASAKGVHVPEDLMVWNLRGHCADHRVLLPELTARLKGEKLAAIILDPTYKVMSGSENAQEEVAALMDSIEKLALNTDAAVIFGSHFAKGNSAGKEAIDRISGSGVFARDPDAILTMTRHEEDDVFVIDAILRNCPPVEPFCVRWQFPLMVIDADLDATKLKKPPDKQGSKKPIPTPERVATVVAINGGRVAGGVKSREGLVSLLRSGDGASERGAIDAIDAAIKNGAIAEVEEPNPKGGGSVRVYRLRPRETLL